ncbi:MAG: haloacid dehalogenase-like hydrolase, partial [Coprobacillus sp.]|nr:haloacid dehalogenase-like hydrolase [Coprobacillus sp.]
MKRSVALFDFDNTIAQGDSIKRLLKYDLKKRPWHIFCFIK